MSAPSCWNAHHPRHVFHFEQSVGHHSVQAGQRRLAKMVFMTREACSEVHPKCLARQISDGEDCILNLPSHFCTVAEAAGIRSTYALLCRPAVC